MKSLIPLLLFWLLSGVIRYTLRQPPAPRRGNRVPQPPPVPERPVMVKPRSANRLGKKAVIPVEISMETGSGGVKDRKPAAEIPAQSAPVPKAARVADRLLLGELSARDIRFGIVLAEVLGPPRCRQPYHRFPDPGDRK